MRERAGTPFSFPVLPDGWWFGPISTIGRRICSDCRGWIEARELHWYRTGAGFICNPCEAKQRPHAVMELCPQCSNWNPAECLQCNGVGYVRKAADR